MKRFTAETRGRAGQNAAMAKNTSSLLQIFRAGRHTAMSGAVLDFSDADLAATAAAYDPARSEAPIVVGHPKTDGPAYGWVRSLSFAEGGLEAEPHQVDPAFAELVDAGRFKKISASFFTPDAPNNPVPGVYYLRHVGFLGAQPPAVKGLRSPEFADGDEGVVSFACVEDSVNAALWRGLREWLIAERGLDVANQVVPDYQVQALDAAAQQDSCDDAQPMPSAFADYSQENLMTPQEMAALQAENAKLRQQVKESADAALAARRAATTARHEAFADTLIGAGRLLPAQRPVAVALLDHLADHDLPASFAEGEESKPLLAGVQSLLESLPVQVSFEDIATREQRGPAVDRNDPVALAKAAQAFQDSEMAAGRSISIEQAVATLAKASR